MTSKVRAVQSAISSLDWFQKAVAVGAAAITAWGTLVTINTSRNSERLHQLESTRNQRKEERFWAKELYGQYDAIVSKEADERAKIDRLAGLLALVDLTDDPGLKAKWAVIVQQQAGRYEAALRAKSAAKGSPEVASQLQQYSRLQRDAAATAVQSHPVWSNYDFDIFWCPGDDNRAAARAIAGLKKLDPEASGFWRVRPIARDNPQIGNKAPFSVIWDYEDEQPFATSLSEQITRLDLAQMRGTQLRLLHAQPSASRWYVSVFVCR